MRKLHAVVPMHPSDESLRNLYFPEITGQSRSENRVPDASGVRVVLIDDHVLLRAGISSLISASDGFSIVGEAKDKSQAIAHIKHQQPDVILLNIELKSGDGLEMVPELLAACQKSRLAVLTDSRDPEIHRRAILLGASGVISKDDPPSLLLKAIARVHAGGAWLVTAGILGELLSPKRRKEVSPERKKTAGLTQREREVIKLAGCGLKNKQIGERLFISAVTVHHHLTSIYSKLEVNDRVELLMYAYRNGLAEPPR